MSDSPIRGGDQPIERKSAATSWPTIRRFRLWTKEGVDGVARPALATPPNVLDDVPLWLYLHIPFCRKRCHFLLLPCLHRQERVGGAGLSRCARPRVGALQRAGGRLSAARSSSSTSAAGRRPTYRSASSSRWCRALDAVSSWRSADDGDVRVRARDAE